MSLRHPACPGKAVAVVWWSWLVVSSLLQRRLSCRLSFITYSALNRLGIRLLPPMGWEALSHYTLKLLRFDSAGRESSIPFPSGAAHKHLKMRLVADGVTESKALAATLGVDGSVGRSATFTQDTFKGRCTQTEAVGFSSALGFSSFGGSRSGFSWPRFFFQCSLAVGNA